MQYKSEQQEKEEIIAKLKEENENLLKQLNQKTDNNNNIMQSDEKELTDLYNLCKKYQSEIERERI